MISIHGCEQALRSERCAACGVAISVGQPFCHRHSAEILGLRIARSTIPNAGHGLVAVRRFEPGALLCPYVADRISPEALHGLYGDATAAYAVTVGRGVIWDAATRRGIGSFANTGPPKACNASLYDTPGAALPPALRACAKYAWLRATRRIDAGDEIVLNYGDEYALADATPSATHFGLLGQAMVQ